VKTRFLRDPTSTFGIFWDLLRIIQKVLLKCKNEEVLMLTKNLGDVFKPVVGTHIPSQVCLALV